MQYHRTSINPLAPLKIINSRKIQLIHILTGKPASSTLSSTVAAPSVTPAGTTNTISVCVTDTTRVTLTPLTLSEMAFVPVV